MNHYYNVKPRYSGGSPAQVDFDTATKVVDDEKQFYDHALSGVYGEVAASGARLAGLGGIVEDITERADCWLVTDMLTGDRFIRLFPKDAEYPERRIVKRDNKIHRLRRKYGLEVRE